MRARITALFLVSLLGLSLAVSGCQFLPGGSQTIGDPNAAFHIEVPNDWTARSDDGVITLYGDESLPETSAAIADTPWVFVYSQTTTASADATGTEALTAQVAALADARATARKWSNVELGKPKRTTLGGEPAATMTMKATDDQRREFEGRLTLSRSGTNEVLVFAFAGPGSFTQKEYDRFADRFFWHTDGTAKK